MDGVKRGRHFLGGVWQAHRPDFEKLSPHARAAVGRFPNGTPAEAAAAVSAARDAFPEWRGVSRIHRADCFDRLARIIDRETDALALLMAAECGKTVGECRAEVVEGLHMVQYVFGTGRGSVGEIVASEIAEKDAFVRRKPRGVVAVVTPWNFPFAVPLWMLGPSLLEGNTCVFKPSEDTPGVGERIVELFVEAGFPAGTLNLVHGHGQTGAALVADPRVNVVGFTGSSAVGTAIMQVSASIPDRIVAAEMGGKSPVVVCEDARLDLAVPAGVLSAFKTTGQRCVSAGRILVHRSRFEEYVERFTAAAKRVVFGDPFDAGSFAGPIINAAQVEKVLAYNSLAADEATRLILPGGRLPGSGNYVSPCVFTADYTPHGRCIREEVFGPHVALIPFDDDAEAVRIVNDTPYGLSMAVITESFRRARLYRDECDYGMGYVNLPCIGAEVHLPFGGVKASGNGHPSAAGLIESVTHKTAWTVNHALGITMAQGLRADV